MERHFLNVPYGRGEEGLYLRVLKLKKKEREERKKVDLQSRPSAEFAPSLQIIGDYHRSTLFTEKNLLNPSQHRPY